MQDDQILLNFEPVKRKRMEGKIIIRIKNIFSKPWSVLLLAAILFLPLLFLGTRTSHDWGDDFAQYIHQAGNIIHGIPQSETGFIYSQLNYIGPQAYPVGFPLMLAPVYAIAGNNMPAFTTFISLLYILLGLLMVVFYRQYFSWITALVLAIIFLYNPQMIIFKREVMSDIPFTVMLVLNFILYQKFKTGSLKQLVLLAFVTGCMLTVRPAGIVFVAAVMMEQLVAVIRRKISLRDFGTHSAIFILIPVLLYFIINSLIFKIPSGGSIRDYLLFYYSGNFIQIIPENLAHHIEVFRYLYVPQAGVFNGLSLLLGSVMVAMTLLGFIKRMRQGLETLDWFFIFYVIMLLVFPNNYSAYRLMVPLGFIFLFYSATGLKTIQLIPGLTASRKAISIGIIILLLFMPGLISIARSGSNILEGPQQKTAVEAFGYIQKNVQAEAVVVFAKPRALALYAGCRSMADPFTTDPTLIHKQVMEAKATYLLINNKLTSEPMQRYSRVMQDRITKQWGNKEFVLYRINPVSP
jgi:4-amino-4-deoxy-L-arabinose transferase-like glycosyltransferase